MSRPLRCHFTDGQVCPYCAWPFARLLGCVAPEPAALTVCPACLGMVLFDERLHPQKITAEQWAGVAEEDRACLFELRAALLHVYVEHARRTERSAALN